MGGTWDLFRYPGIRSDSDMYTLGYSFKPWEEPKAIADGPSILKYVKDTARDYGIDRRIRYGHQVRRASWSTADACWTVESESAGSRAVHLQLPLRLRRLLQVFRRLHARVSGHRALQGPHRAPAEVDRRHRLRGKTRGRDRQRRHRRDARAGDGEDRRARDHAAALADLRRRPSGRGRSCQQAAPVPARDARVHHHALETGAAADVFLQPVPAQSPRTRRS